MGYYCFVNVSPQSKNVLHKWLAVEFRSNVSNVHRNGINLYAHNSLSVGMAFSTRYVVAVDRVPHTLESIQEHSKEGDFFALWTACERSCSRCPDA